MKRGFSQGFTVLELMVVISIIGILSAVVLANMASASKNGRDAKRQSDLRNIEIAVSQYKQKYNKYPDMGTCTDTNSDGLVSEKECNGTPYITGLAPEFMTTLPKDTARGTAEGYAYITNTSGTSYKVMAMGTVENETVTAASQFRSCDISTNGLCLPATGVCVASNARFQASYALWGGYADGVDDAAVKSATAAVICK